MNKQDELFLAELYKDRAELADALEKPAARGIKNSVVEKYSDQAHFIYELLQNADDAHASNAKFILEKDRLIFSHDGNRYFSVTDPKREDADTKAGIIGDINSITSIANSNKTQTQASIGKFGVGFKAVFQYTNTPHIYDPGFKFKIDRFIVPSLLESDFPERKPNETLFVFPFDHQERSPEEAYNDISNKLKNLSYPLLFLSRLENIEFLIEGFEGFYGKKICNKFDSNGIMAECLKLAQFDGSENHDDTLWLFSRIDEKNYKYSVGFFLDQDGKLTPVNKPAFCFFPTKETTGLKFIIHAPFLLTDSREGIRAGIPHNERMVNLLADLAADSIVLLKKIGEKQAPRLIDDNIINIIPYKLDDFSSPENKDRISFQPFYYKIFNTFKENSIIPSTDGYTKKENAYWAAVPQLPQLFSNKQLTQLSENPNAKWVFTSIGRDELQRNNKDLTIYIDSLIRTNVNEEAIISGRNKEFSYNRYLGTTQSLENFKGITAKFIEAQPFDWLHKFYKWLSETKKRTDLSKTKPFFIDQNRNAVAAFDKKDQLILFLPVEGISGFITVNTILLENEDTQKFVKSIGITQPSRKDQIYNQILPLYRNQNSNLDTMLHFQKFFEYFQECSISEVDEFIKLIKDYPFLSCYSADNLKIPAAKADSLYFPVPLLVEYFESKKETRFLDLETYKKMIPVENHEQLISFFEKLGVKRDVQILSIGIDYSKTNRIDLPCPNSSRPRIYQEKVIDGCKEIINDIITQKDKSKSVCLWKVLLSIIEKNCYGSRNKLFNLLSGTCSYFFRKSQVLSFLSSDVIMLRESTWLMGSTGEFTSPKLLSVGTLSELYDLSSEYVSDLVDFLEIKTTSDPENDPYSNLTEDQKAKILFANELEALGFTENDLEDFKEFKRLKDHKRESKLDDNTHETKTVKKTDDIIDSVESELQPESNIDRTTVKVMKDIITRTSKYSSEDDTENDDQTIDTDNDELLPRVVDYKEKISRAKEKSASEIEKIAHLEELQDQALEAEKYSYGWFTALLELELLNSKEGNANSKEISIQFGKVEKEPGTQRTLVLKQPNIYIPQFIEDLADIPLVLHMENGTKNIPIEVSNIVSYSLRVKIKNGESIDDIDLSQVKYASIDALSPVFLLKELKKQFTAMGNELGYEDNYNLKDNLCKNIDFIFGPPGTGKTTYLANQILLPIIKQNKQTKVLVMTPTNKAADVLVRRIMEICGDDHSYEEWLIRFGTTSDDTIEKSPVFKDKTYNILKHDQNVVVTTIARFAYDYFIQGISRIYLYGMNWDYIVIDEASMIPIVNIIFPLYKKTPIKFIIAGDPFQIEPITTVDMWRAENIYSMVELNSFAKPETKPHLYNVTLLTTQYRSIPDIGKVFSEFAYNGILKHHRTSESQKRINFGKNLNVGTLNIIKFPVSKYESIYRAKRLQHSSSYQIYSALFIYEYISYMVKEIAENNPSGNFSIGVIAPYRAQADLIDKLLGSERFPKRISVQVGTIHSFQGDECDIIFSVFNTPPNISQSKEMFLNKMNIINVSISRARDYLFIVMPNDETENISNLILVKRVEHLIQKSGAWEELLSPDIEKIMFGDSNYLENNAFSTSHQSVNVYGLPEKSYEVRTEENAVDIQVHKGTQVEFTESQQEILLDQFETDQNQESKKELGDILRKYEIQYIDNRKNGGSLWIIGGQELVPIVQECNEIGVTFHFKKGGGRASRGQDAWWTYDKSPV